MREYFPFFNNTDVTYMDSAATSQALYTVIDDQHDFNLRHRANAHRSGHSMGSWINDLYYNSKEKIGTWLGIDNAIQRVVYTSGSTQALDDAVRMVARVYKRATIFIGKDFHHSLFLPLHGLASGNSFFNIEIIDIDADGKLDLTDLRAKMMRVSGPKILAFTPVSNVLGMINDLEEIKQISKLHGAVTIVDASQIISKRVVDFNGFDFVAFSWHKIYGPMGLGCLILGDRWIDYDPIRPGGGSVTQVTLTSARWSNDASRFESGTANLSAIAAIPRLVDWLVEHRQEIVDHDIATAQFACSNLTDNFVSLSQSESSLICLIPKIGTCDDYSMLLDSVGVLVRTGNLCAEPLVKERSSHGLIRLSWAAYTIHKDIEQTFDKLGEAYARLQKHVR